MTQDNKNIIILLYRYDVPQINITYKDRKDLFRTFKKELKKHHLSINEVFWSDYDNGDRSVIRNADDLFGAVAHSNCVKMNCRPTGDHPLFTPPNSDDDETKCEKSKNAKKRKAKTCATSASKKTLQAIESADETKTATFKLYRDNLPRITITYKDKKDLFKQFQNIIKTLNLPRGEVYWGDVWEDERIIIENADDLFEFVKNNAIVKMYYRRTDGSQLLACCSSDEDEHENKRKDVTEKNQCRTRSRSCARRHHRSRSAPSLPHSHSSWNQMPSTFAPWNFMMDPPFAFGLFPRCPHPSGNDYLCGYRSHQCHCGSLSDDLGDL